jgi:hypothetical protein
MKIVIMSDEESEAWRIGMGNDESFSFQKMVDFFWNVGAPETEIDRLNEIGGVINPPKIGSWIDMSAKGGMDGGWYFPVEMTLKLAIEAADSGNPARKLSEWAERNNIATCIAIGRGIFNIYLFVFIFIGVKKTYEVQPST